MRHDTDPPSREVRLGQPVTQGTRGGANVASPIVSEGDQRAAGLAISHLAQCIQRGSVGVEMMDRKPKHRQRYAAQLATIVSLLERISTNSSG
jgi:hypothetical protein